MPNNRDLNWRGWFADITDDEFATAGYPWFAYVQTQGACHRLDGVSFATEAECADYIRTEILPATRILDP